MSFNPTSMFSPGDSVQIALRTSKTPGIVICVMFRKPGVTYDVWDGNTTLRDIDESMLEPHGFSGPQFYYNGFLTMHQPLVGISGIQGIAAQGPALKDKFAPGECSIATPNCAASFGHPGMPQTSIRQSAVSRCAKANPL